MSRKEVFVFYGGFCVSGRARVEQLLRSFYGLRVRESNDSWLMN